MEDSLEVNNFSSFLSISIHFLIISPVFRGPPGRKKKCQRRKVDGKALPEAVDASSCASTSLTSLERVVATVWEDTIGGGQGLTRVDTG